MSGVIYTHWHAKKIFNVIPIFLDVIFIWKKFSLPLKGKHVIASCEIFSLSYSSSLYRSLSFTSTHFKHTLSLSLSNSFFLVSFYLSLFSYLSIFLYLSLSPSMCFLSLSISIYVIKIFILMHIHTQQHT